ncbi:MAG: putative ABC exporter domain-containing protein, partial [Clostridiales bacterium]|nr:putative ABC exporter domain-containing protein [Clostridiales bacterium]
MWGYYAWHTFVNSIKRMFRKEFVAVILIIMLVAGIFGFGAGFIGDVFFPGEETESTMEEDTADTDSDTEALFLGDLTIEISDYDEDAEMTPEEARQAAAAAEMVIAIVFILLLLIGIKGGSKNGAEIFTMADVNFLFPSPRKPQTVLLFRMTFTMAAQLFGMAYLLYWIPSLAMDLELSVPEALIMVAGIVMAMVYMRLFSLLSYMLMTTIPGLRKLMWPFIFGVAAGVVAVTYAAYMASGRDFF